MRVEEVDAAEREKTKRVVYAVIYGVGKGGCHCMCVCVFACACLCVCVCVCARVCTLLKMGSYSSRAMCQYWDNRLIY